LIGIKTIKEFVKVPKITSKNQHLKDEIIEKTEELLNLENAKLSDFVNFKNIFMQKFDKVRVENENLILQAGNQKITCEISHNFETLKKLHLENISLYELKNLQIIDFEKQNILKKEIDDLVFALYFNEKPDNVEKNEFYELTHKV